MTGNGNERPPPPLLLLFFQLGEHADPAATFLEKRIKLVAVATNLFWKLEGGNYLRKEIIVFFIFGSDHKFAL